jgi:hypothetical protein
MARILAVDEVPASLRSHLLRSLRGYMDEAVLLPQSERGEETGRYKNVVFRFAGSEPHVPIDVFSPNWFSGVSGIKLDTRKVRKILDDPAARAAALVRLREAIPSEMADTNVTVGPELDCDDADRDKRDWTPGFDSSACFVGLFLAEHSCAPDQSRKGLNRIHQEAWLMCKAGAGLAASTFHTRLIGALRKGISLEDALERGEPGPVALRRVSMAGTRNRARILELAGKALGLITLDTVPDQSSNGKYRSAVTSLDVTVNSLRKVEDDEQGKSRYQYTTCVDAPVSHGLVTLSNPGDGLVVFLSPEGDVRYTLKNGPARCALPFATRRIQSDKATLSEAAEEHQKHQKRGKETTNGEGCLDGPHPDHDFVHKTFTWKNRRFPERPDAPNIEPLPLWGTHDHEYHTHQFSRELGVSPCQAVRLRPFAVCVAGIDPGKLRGAVRRANANEGVNFGD